MHAVRNWTRDQIFTKGRPMALQELDFVAVTADTTIGVDIVELREV